MFFSTSTLLSVLSTSTVVLSIPLSTNSISARTSGCSVAGAQLSLPANQTSIAVPSGTPIYVALGFGTQNYTCGATGTYASVGAVAQLFDLSCFVNSASFSTAQETVYNLGPNAQGQTLISNILLNTTPVLLGNHYFIANPAVGGTGVSPTFDFRAGVEQGDANAFVVAKKVGDMASPAGSANVDWLGLQNIGGTIGGTLANSVMRVDTYKGQPPTSCTPNATIAVPYTAKYCKSFHNTLDLSVQVTDTFYNFRVLRVDTTSSKMTNPASHMVVRRSRIFILFNSSIKFFVLWLQNNLSRGKGVSDLCSLL
ncbi:hypothetical protein BDV93DRAFT_449243 [Ceratobasidium sp. AG-I]|nr:hypothetical protein BDV93DRAFT_449243 [Ceratobasidium sp. AG-I]